MANVITTPSRGYPQATTPSIVLSVLMIAAGADCDCSPAIAGVASTVLSVAADRQRHPAPGVCLAGGATRPSSGRFSLASRRRRSASTCWHGQLPVWSR